MAVAVARELLFWMWNLRYIQRIFSVFFSKTVQSTFFKSPVKWTQIHSFLLHIQKLTKDFWSAHSGFSTWKKNQQQKYYFQWTFNLAPLPFQFDAYPTELIWHLQIYVSDFKILICSFFFNLTKSSKSKIKWCTNKRSKDHLTSTY